MGVSKTSFCHSTPYMRALADERSSHEKQKTKMTQLMEETGGLRKELDELKQTLSQGGDADAVTHLSWEFFSGSMVIFHRCWIPKIK